MDERLRKGLDLLKGLSFSPDVTIQSSKEIYKALVSTIGRHLPPDNVAVNISARFAALLSVCLMHKDVYQRLRGNEAFWTLVQSSWVSPYILQAEEIKDLVHLIVDARHRHLLTKKPDDNEVESFVKHLDTFIMVIDGVTNTRTTRGVMSLTAPKNDVIKKRMQDKEAGSIIWPPAYFSPGDIAVVGEQGLRKTLFGINPDLTAEDELEPLYPTDQSDPVTVRTYLAWLSLTEQKPAKKVSLFLAPVAFLRHDQRQVWQETTGLKARFYATVEEFMKYARFEMDRNGTQGKDHVLGLMTPWFFDIPQIAQTAALRMQSIPTTWQQRCYRAGAVFMLSKSEKHGNIFDYELTVFKPGLPVYKGAAEPSDRRPKQEAWIKDAVSVVKHHFRIVRVWYGGSAKRHSEPDPARKMSGDSVEVASEFITEIMEDPGSLPKDRKELWDRYFWGKEMRQKVPGLSNYEA